MAIAATNLATATNAADQSSYATASITPTANRLVLALVNHRTSTGSPNTPTASGNSLTWVNIGTTNYNGSNRRLTLFRALGSAPSAGSITFDFASQTQTSAGWSVVEFSGVDTSGTNGSGAVVQTVADEIIGNTALTVTLAAFASANNATYGGFASGDGALTATAGSGFTIVAQTNGGDISTASEFKSTNDTGVDITWSASNDIGGIAVEIKAASGTNPRRMLLGVGT